MSNLRSLTFDAIIVGGGGSGLRAALELAKSGKDGRVIESFPDPLAYRFCPGWYYLCDRVR